MQTKNIKIMKKSFLLVLTLMVSCLAYSQEEEPSVFVMSIPSDTMSESKTVNKDKKKEQHSSYIWEENDVVISVYEIVFMPEYISSLEKDTLDALLEKTKTEGQKKLIELIGGSFENEKTTKSLFKSKYESIKTESSINGLDVENITIRAQNCFLNITLYGSVKSKEARNFIEQIEIIEVE